MAWHQIDQAPQGRQSASTSWSRAGHGPRAGHGAPHGRHAVRKLLFLRRIYLNIPAWCFGELTPLTLSRLLCQRILYMLFHRHMWMQKALCFAVSTRGFFEEILLPGGLSGIKEYEKTHHLDCCFLLVYVNVVIRQQKNKYRNIYLA